MSSGIREAKRVVISSKTFENVLVEFHMDMGQEI